jgi:hypothetical protein
MNLIGIDFSINKPATCVFSNNKYHFFGWPHNLKDDIFDVYCKSGVNLIKRTDIKYEGHDLSLKMRFEVENSKYLANLIRETLLPYLNENTYIAFEGLAYASKGDSAIQLGAYKCLLMNELNKYVPLKNMFTYTPITIKSIAGCAKRVINKTDMINAFIKNGPICKFRIALFEKPELFQSPKAKNWIIHLDDLVDSYFALETLRKKENI